MTNSAVKEDKGELIRQAAIRVFARYGFHDATAQQIAQEAGVAVGTLYNYFKSKDDILIHIFQTEVQERLALMQEIFSNGKPIRQQLRQAMDMHVERALQNKEIMRLFLGEELHLGGVVEEHVHQLFKEIPRRIAGLLEAAMARGELRKTDPLLAAHAAFGANRAVVARLCLYEDKDAKRLQSSAAAELADFIWRALKPDKIKEAS